MATIKLIPEDYRQALAQLKTEIRTVIRVDEDGYLVIARGGILDCDEYDRLKKKAVEIAKLRLRQQAID